MNFGLGSIEGNSFKISNKTSDKAFPSEESEDGEAMLRCASGAPFWVQGERRHIPDGAGDNLTLCDHLRPSVTGSQGVPRHLSLLQWQGHPPGSMLPCPLCLQGTQQDSASSTQAESILIPSAAR